MDEEERTGGHADRDRDEQLGTYREQEQGSAEGGSAEKSIIKKIKREREGEES
jgi:hypothetical protein